MPHPQTRPVRFRRLFIDSSLERTGRLIRDTFLQWESSSKDGLLQRIDARVKLVSLLFLLVVATLKHHIVPELVLAGLLFVVAAASRLDLRRFYRHVGMLTFLFGFLIALPAAFNLFTNGEVIVPLVTFPRSYRFWVYTIPQTLGITREGLSVVGLITLRVANCLALSFMLFSTTSIPQIARALTVFRIQDTLLIVFVLTYKYVFIFSSMLEENFMARKSRLAGPIQRRKTDEWIAGRMALLLRKTRVKGEEVYRAMMSRGMGRNIELPASGRIGTPDLLAGGVLVFLGVLIWWM